MTDNDSAMDTLGRKLKLDPELMDDVSTRFLKQADDFDGRIGTVRKAMSASNGGGDGWGSVSSNPIFGEILKAHKQQLQDAETFIASVTEDLAIMGRNTRALKGALLGKDGDNGSALNSLYPSESSRDDGGYPIVEA